MFKNEHPPAIVTHPCAWGEPGVSFDTPGIVTGDSLRVGRLTLGKFPNAIG